MVLRHCEALSRRQFVVGVERGRMAHDAALPLENLLSSLSKSVELVRVRRLKRVDVETQGVKLLIAVTVRLSEGRTQLVGARQRLKVCGGRNESLVAGQVVRALVQRRVAHHVHNAAILLESRPVEIMAIFNANQVRYLGRVDRA